MQIATDVGFAPPVLVKSSIITCEEPELKKIAGRQCPFLSLTPLSPPLSPPLLLPVSLSPYSSSPTFLLYSSPPPLTFSLSPSFLTLDLLFYRHHYQQYQFSNYTTQSTESAGGLQFCSATYCLMKVNWSKETSAEDPLMEVKYKGQNWQLLLCLQACKVTVGHN